MQPYTCMVHNYNFAVCKPTLCICAYKWISTMQSQVQSECVDLEVKIPTLGVKINCCMHVYEMSMSVSTSMSDHICLFQLPIHCVPYGTR